jgi:hypothetical protein
MHYAPLILEKPGYNSRFSNNEQRQAVPGEGLALRDYPRVTSGAAPQPAMRMHDGGKFVTDGPFTDTAEVFGGFTYWTSVWMRPPISRGRLGQPG